MTSNMFSFFPLLFLSIFSDLGESLKIVELRVPTAVANTTGGPVTLDCDYSLELGSPEGLVLKWFLNDTPNPVYQWIPGRAPRSLGLLKDRLDLSYKASEDSRKVYRALRILEPSVELTGNYTCSVSTFEDEARQTKHMTIYTPASRFDFAKEESEEEITLKCAFAGVYPEPYFNVTFSEGSDLEPRVNRTAVQGGRDSLYESEMRLTFFKRELTARTEFNCELSLPLTDYAMRKTIVLGHKRQATPVPENYKRSQVSAPDAGVTAPNHYDPDIFFIRNYQGDDGVSSGNSVEAAAFSIFLLSFLVSVRV